jgi:hypothetical protein
MRLYSYTNMYMEGIHAGIQTSHAVNELWVKYDATDPGKAYSRLVEWAADHKTIYVYNGGLSSMLWSRYQMLREFAKQFDLPIARFYESKDALNGALTCVALVVPEEYYRSQPARFPQTFPPQPKTDKERFHELLHNCERAR